MVPLARRSAKQLLRQAAELMEMAKAARAPELKSMLESLAARYRELAARRAAVASLSADDPARDALAHSIERLARSITAADH
jgi:hypothetical protein